MSDTLEMALNELVSAGCYPGIHRRGKMWRAHINIAGNFWAEDTDPVVAVRRARLLWEKKGCPVDGMAAA